MFRSTPKDPGAVLDYVWNPVLDTGDTIASAASSTVTEGSVVVDSQQFDDTSLTLWLSGGVDGEVCKIELSVTTAGGRTFTDTLEIPIRETSKRSVTLALAKQHLEYDDTDRDILISSYIQSARRVIENKTGLSLSPVSFEDIHWAFDDRIELTRGPVSSLISITYEDSEGVEQTVAGARFSGGYIRPPINESWPITYGGPIKVNYVAGFTDVPDDLISAQLLLVGHFFANREAASSGGGGFSNLPLGVESLLDPYISKWVL